MAPRSLSSETSMEGGVGALNNLLQRPMYTTSGTSRTHVGDVGDLRDLLSFPNVVHTFLELLTFLDVDRAQLGECFCVRTNRALLSSS